MASHLHPWVWAMHWQRLWCRLFHLDDWICQSIFGEPWGPSRVLLHCGRPGCGYVWTFRIAIPARSPVGKTPR